MVKWKTIWLKYILLFDQHAIIIILWPNCLTKTIPKQIVINWSPFKVWWLVNLERRKRGREKKRAKQEFSARLNKIDIVRKWSEKIVISTMQNCIIIQLIPMVLKNFTFLCFLLVSARIYTTICWQVNKQMRKYTSTPRHAMSLPQCVNWKRKKGMNAWKHMNQLTHTYKMVLHHRITYTAFAHLGCLIPHIYSRSFLYHCTIFNKTTCVYLCCITLPFQKPFATTKNHLDRAEKKEI